MEKMTCKKTGLIHLILSAVLLLTAAGCVRYQQEQTPGDEAPPFASYRGIPGLSQQDLQEIEQVLDGRESFSYAMMLSTEAFYGKDNNIQGYSKHFSNYLSQLFGVTFIPEIVSFERLLEGLENGSIDFTGTLTATPERMETYHMTDPIAQRAIKYFRLAGSEPIADIEQERTPRYAMLGRAASTQTVLSSAFIEFEPVFVDEYIDAYELLKSGQIDALLAENSVETIFDDAGDIVKEDFFPMINAFVSFTAYKEELAPIVNAVQKLLENGGAHYLGTLHEEGQYEYLFNKLSRQLTSDEQEYIKDNPVILFGAEFDNYPISFLDQRSGQWQGISLDVLGEICKLTGLVYTVINAQDATFNELLDMLIAGDIHMMSELIMTPEREGRFLQPDRPFISDKSVLISRTDYHNVNLDRVYSEKIGLVKNTAHAEFFLTWFPNHPETVVFDDHYAAMDALENGGIDLVMTSYSTTLYMSNYLEETKFRPSIIFNNSFESTFGVNISREELLSIINKALELIDIETITDHWLHKTYDYRLRIAEENNALFRSMILVMLCGLMLLIALLLRNRQMSRKLGELVDSKTQELAESVKEISSARDEAERANRSKSYFLANMSHEIRTPMNAIAGITEIILLNENIPDDIKEGLYKINSSCNLLMGIINDILDFSKIEAGKLDIIEKEYNVAGLISDSIQLNLMRIGDKPLKFISDIDENTPLRLIGDELRIKQILNNLLSNAFKYTAAGTVVLKVTAQAVSEETINLVISVSDTGCGISEKQLGKLYDDYTRFEEAGVNLSIEGTGLGLPITRRLISLMHGDIQVESKVGKGTVFTVQIPQIKTDDSIIGKENTEILKQFRQYDDRSGKGQSIVRDPMPYGYVLAVDDVETNLYVSIGLLKPYMLKIDTAMSGQEAIDLIKSGKIYDIIFMDHMMPEMDGVETVRHIRDLGYTAPIVALTANAVAGQSDMFLENGFDDFISKPIDIRQLNSVLNRLIRDKQPPDEVERAREEYNDTNSKRNGKPEKNGENSQNPDNSSGEHKQSAAQNQDIAAGQNPAGIANSAINGLDINKGLEKYNYDEDIYLKILSSYEANARSILDNLSGIGEVNEQSLDQYRLKVHSMKGTSLDIYADEIGSTAARLENEAKAGNLDYINEHTDAFIKTARMVIDGIDTLLKEIHGSIKKDAKDYPDKEILVRLREACDNYSMDGVNEAMDEIEKYNYENDDGLAAWLREKVNIMAFTEIVEKLNDI